MIYKFPIHGMCLEQGYFYDGLFSRILLNLNYYLYLD